MKELSKEFIGIGEVRGFQFKQLHFNGYAYMYQVYSPEANRTYYEVFERVENESFNCVSYPKSKSFGVWAWCMRDYDKACLKFDEITKKVINRLEKRQE
jgi:hypothetical protein